MHRIKVGVVGAGHWGPHLIRNCAELGVLDSVCDIDENALGVVRQSYPTVATTTSLDVLLSRSIDAVVVATPAQFHAAMCLRAIDAAKHVFVEKPLALSVDEGKQVAVAADRAGLIVFVGHVLLYHPAVRRLRALIADGVIGPVWHFRSRRLSLGKLRNHENVWWSFAPHDVALMLAIMNEEPEWVVAAQAASGHAELSDVAYADFEFSEGRSAHLEVNWLDPEKSARLDVFGTRGVITLIDSRKGGSLTLKPTTITDDSRGMPVVLRAQEQNIDFAAEEPLRSEIIAFIDSVKTGMPAETNARQGVSVLNALAMAEEAACRQAKLRALA